MTNEAGRKLKKKKEFLKLMFPLEEEAYKKLEQTLSRNGCTNTIICWQGILIDGYHEYEICNRRNIPYETQEITFDSSEAVISWICSRQLKRQDLRNEQRKYLIGTCFSAEKKNLLLRGHNRMGGMGSSAADIAQNLSRQYGILAGTIQKYAAYARAIDVLLKKDESIVRQIMGGKMKLSHENTIFLSRLSKEEIQQWIREKNENQQAAKSVSLRKTQPSTEVKTAAVTIKDMPIYDPDAEIDSLTLTVPSWTGFICRVYSKTNMETVSVQAKKKLSDVLQILQEEVTAMMGKLQEEYNGRL